MAKVHERILELNLAMVAAADTVAVSSAKYYRNRADVEDSTGFTLTTDTTSAQTSPAEIQLGELVPPPTVIRLVFADF